ncbi:MAG: glutathione S-transferase family protein [Lautropia sp.]|nr:glutathione S-transferase family protein [Lautropia sp.]
MKLFLNETSPFARFVLMVAAEHGREDLLLEWVDPWNATADFLSRSPFSMIPVMETDQGNLLHESVLMALHLSESPVTDEALLARLGYFKTLMECSFRAVILGKYAAGEDSVLRNRRLASVRRGLQGVEHTGLRSEVFGSEPPVDLASLAAAAALDYVRFRLGALFDECAGSSVNAFLAAASARRSFAQTRPESLALRGASLGEMLAASR